MHIRPANTSIFIGRNAEGNWRFVIHETGNPEHVIQASPPLASEAHAYAACRESLRRLAAPEPEREAAAHV